MMLSIFVKKVGDFWGWGILWRHEMTWEGTVTVFRLIDFGARAKFTMFLTQSERTLRTLPVN